MPRKLILLIGCFWLSLSFIQAQCLPEKDLRNRIIYYNDNPDLPSKIILGELGSYLAEINDCPYKNDSTHVFYSAGLLKNILGQEIM